METKTSVPRGLSESVDRLKNMAAAKAGAEQNSIVLKMDESDRVGDRRCGICGGPPNGPGPVGYFLEGTDKPVCSDCAEKHTPTLWGDTLVFQYEGNCPECGEWPDLRSVRGTQHMCCHDCKVRWCIGYNVYSCWREETEETWRENDALLQTYKEVKPLRWPATRYDRERGALERRQAEAEGKCPTCKTPKDAEVSTCETCGKPKPILGSDLPF